MYSQEIGMRVNEKAQKHTREREALARQMKTGNPPRLQPEEKSEPGLLSGLNLNIGSEDAILVALIIFLLSDSTENDLLLLGVLIYLLLF